MNENLNITGRLWLEWQKVNRRFYGFVLIGAPAIVFLLTTAFLLFKKESLGDLSVALIIDNSVGFCSSLLYPLLLMVIVQTQVDVEHKGNLLAYGKSYKRSWLDVFLYKSGVILISLFILTLCNLLANLGIYQIASGFMLSPDDADLMQHASFDLLKVTLAMIPAAFFHLMLGFLIPRNGITYILGILLIVLGIPIANLTNVFVNPYSFGIFALKPSAGSLSLILSGIVIMILSILWTNRRLQA